MLMRRKAIDGMKKLEANGANIPALGLGTWQLTGETCSQIVSDAVDAGYRHIDTAIMYGNEQHVGDGIRNSGIDREELFLTTKVWPTEMTAAAFDDAVQGSLERLGVDYVDLLLIHWPPHTGDCREWAGLVNNAADRGWTRHIGVSNFTIAQMNEMVAVSERPIACNQVEHHPFLDQSALKTACAEHGIALMGYCPLFRGAALFEEPLLARLGEKYDRSPVQIVLRWHMQQDGTGAIPKTATSARLSENLDVFDFSLDGAEMAGISALGARNDRICDTFEFAPQWD